MHGSIIFFFFLGGGGGGVHEGREDPNTSISGPSLASQGKAIKVVCRWWPNIESWLGSYVVFQGSEPVLLRNSIFSKGGGEGGGAGPPLDLPMNDIELISDLDPTSLLDM